MGITQEDTTQKLDIADRFLKALFFFPPLFLFYCGKNSRSAHREEEVERNLRRKIVEIVSFRTI